MLDFDLISHPISKLYSSQDSLLFSAHISYGKGKYLNQTGFFFFLQNLPRFYLYLNLRVLPIEFNPHKFSFVRYVFVEIFEVFLKNDENDENDPLMTK